MFAGFDDDTRQNRVLCLKVMTGAKHDISVSRFHAVIKFEQDSFWLEDNASKFGTLIDATTKFTFEEPEEIVLQVGRTVLHCRYS